MDTRQRNTKKRTAGRTPAGGSGRRTQPTTRRRTEAGYQKGTASQTRRRRPADTRRPSRRAAPDVVYTPAKPFSRSRFLLRILTVAAVVLAITAGISIFFKVKNITVSGNVKYSPWAIREVSGIQEGDNLLAFGRARAFSRILKELPYVKDGRIGIKLPDTVYIEIVESDVVYAVQADDATWWLIRSDGVAVEKTDVASAGDYTKILGFRIANPEKGQAVTAMEAVTQTDPTAAEPSDGTDATDDSDVTDPITGTNPVTVTNQQRLDTTLTIVRNLEANDIIGDAASVDVTDMGNLQLWYGDQYLVELGDGEKLDHKIAYMKKAIDQMEDYQSGILDVSFRIWTDKAGYTPF